MRNRQSQKSPSKTQLAAHILAAMDSAMASGEWDTGELLLRALEELCQCPEDQEPLNAAYARIVARSGR